MLHINDIHYRLKNTPEPKEVAEIREHILSSFSNLEFIEEGHKYYIHNEDGTIDTPISVSGLIKEFEQHVDWDVKAEGVALKEGVTVDVIKRRWKENNLRATNSGTQHHEFGESYMNFVRGLDSSTFCNSCINSIMIALQTGSRPLVGSSNKTTLGVETSALAKDTRFCIPPESSPGIFK